jgi:CBS domain-containing protein
VTLVREAMITDPRVCEADATAQEAGEALSRPEVRAVFVCEEGGRLVGVVTRKTLVREVVAPGRDPAVTRVAGRAGSSFLVYAGPPDDVAVGLYGDLVPGLSYSALVAVPFGHAVADHELAFSFAAWLADEYEGIVYSDQLDEVVWPESRRGEKAAELADDPDVI